MGIWTAVCTLGSVQNEAGAGVDQRPFLWSLMVMKQGVALTGRNTTGPLSRAAPWWVTLRHCGVLQMKTTDASKQNSTGPLHYALAGQ